MKKLKLTVAAVEPFEVSAWALDVPGLAAWNQPGKYEDKVIKMTWKLVHIASGTHIESAYKREHVVAMAEMLAPITDWTADTIDSLSFARTVQALRGWWTAYNEQRLQEAA